MEKKDDNLDMDFMEALAGQGFENMTAGDFPVPFIKILTNGSPEATKGREAYIEGAEPGMFLNTASRKLYKTLDVIPVKYENIWTEWAPNRGGFKGRHAPYSIDVIGDPYSGMKTKDGNDVSDNLVFYCLVIGELHKGLVVLSLKGSGIRHGKNWNQMIRDLRTPSGAPAPFFGGVWRLELFFNENEDGAWYTLGVKKETKVKFVRYITREDYENFVGVEKKRLATQTPMLQIEALRDSEDERESSYPTKDANGDDF